jgi:signal recognition particle subunit SEC65
MAKREKKPKVVKFHLYGNDLEAELKSIREEAKIKEEMHRNWDNPEYWKKVYERSIGEPFPYPDETDAKKVQEILEKRLEEEYKKMSFE